MYLIPYFKSAFENDDTEDILNDGILESNVEFEILFSCVHIHKVETRVKSSNI